MEEPTRREPIPWNYQEGLLELLEDGAGLQDIEQRLLDGELQVPGRSRAGLGRSKLDELIKWLQGFRKERVVYENEKVYLPVIELWAPPGGKASVAYAVGREDSSSAELGLFGLAGFGGSSKREITDSFEFDAGPPGTCFSIGVLMTVTHYVNRSGKGQSFDRIDIKGIEGGIDSRQSSLSPAEFFLPGQEIPEADLLPDNYSDISYRRLSAVTHEGISSYTHKVEDSCEWSFDLSLPLLKDKVRLGAKTSRSSSFDVKFECPNGHDYAFFGRFGEKRAVPYCARVVK